MIKHTQTIRRLLLTNCLSVFDHFVGLALKELTATKMLMPWVFRHTVRTGLFFFSILPLGLKKR